MTQPTSDIIVLLENVRLSYAYLFSPYENEDGSKSYCAHGIFAKSTPNYAKMIDALKRAATAGWPEVPPEQKIKELVGKNKICLYNGDTMKPGVDGYAGVYYVSANAARRPRIVATINGVNEDIPVDHPKAPYSGCYANLIIGVWPQKNRWGQRINAQLQGVQFVNDGDRFGGGRVADLNEFGVVASDADTPLPSGDNADLGL